MPVGQAVAASAAVPGVFEPLPLSRLYPWPTGSGGFMRAQLVDGGVYDNLGTEALLERGCTHFLVSDASGQLADRLNPDLRFGAVISRARDILMDRVRELQLARLEQARPGKVVLMHLLREVEAPALGAVGPEDRGQAEDQQEDTAEGEDRDGDFHCLVPFLRLPRPRCGARASRRSRRRKGGGGRTALRPPHTRLGG